MGDARRTSEPHDRLTRICDRVTDAIAADPEHLEGDKAVIMLADGKRGGLVAHGYDGDDGDLQAAVDVLSHLRAIFEVNGKTLLLMPLEAGSPN